MRDGLYRLTKLIVETGDPPVRNPQVALLFGGGGVGVGQRRLMAKTVPK